MASGARGTGIVSLSARAVSRCVAIDNSGRGDEMQTDLSGRTIAITGASSGIGEATVLACAAAGARVALAARRADRIEALAQRIADEHGADRAVAIPADVGEEAQARDFVERAQRELGRLDGLVNNAGVMLLGPIQGAPTEEWQRMVHVNVFGVLYCTHAALPIMREQGAGDIVNVSSVAGRVASLGAGVYNLTKFGVGAFSESLRQETTGSGIRVTLIEPGAVTTELREHNRPEIIELMDKRIGDTVPLEASDIANAILYAIGQPPNVSVNELLVRPSSQR
jgi:clavulanate-9-aldehyde reducatase